MALKERGKIVEISEIQTGVGKASGKEWRKRDFIIEKETTGTFQSFLCITCFNDKVNLLDNLETGMMVNVECNVDSRSWTDKDNNTRWSANVNAFSVDPVVEEPAPQMEYTATGTPTTAFMPDDGSDDDSGLPF